MITKIISTEQDSFELTGIKSHITNISDLDKFNVITKSVVNCFEIPIENLQIKSRKRLIVLPRQIAQYFTKMFTKFSFAKIGKLIGNKNHATVLHSCRTINNLIKTDRKFAKQIEEIKQIINKNLI